MTTDRHKVDSTNTEPWFRNPWVWLVIAIPALTVVGGLLTIFLAITNPDVIVSDSPTDDNSATRTP